MARASTPALLALDRYAKIMGISPAAFNTLAGDTIFPGGSQCNDLWFQYAWQRSDAVSREDLARAIYDAEEEIGRALGYYPAPKYIAKEMHRYPRHFDRGAVGNGLNVRGQLKSVKTRWGRLIQAGRWATTLIGTATVAGGTLVYSDPDGDGFNERATITLATTLTDACEIKAYFASNSAAPEWEIRPARSKVISGGNVILTFDSWLLVDPTLWEAFPGVDSLSAIDLDTSGNFVTSVEIYREYTDPTQASTEFSWELGPCTSCGGSGCEVCTSSIQTGCMHIRDVLTGLVSPAPATYDTDEAIWVMDTWTECYEPAQVKLWYYAGDLDDRFLAGQTCEPLSDYFAHAIAWLATARLERPFCSCGNAAALAEHLRQDLAANLEEVNFTVAEEVLTNPFGTRRGEVQAWMRISKLTEQVLEVALA